MKRIPRNVWLFAVGFALVLSLPYLLGALSAPPGWQFTGAASSPGGFLVDYNSHLAKMWQGWRGQWDYHLLFTHEPHPGLPTVQGFYVALGALARLFPGDFAVVYHVARFVLSIGMTLAIWVFACHFFEDNRLRWYALLFGTIVSGWSWILLIVAPELTRGGERFPIEFWLFDAYNLLGALYMPHFAAAVILQIVALLAYETWVLSDDVAPRSLFLMSVALFLDAIIQPYVVLLTFGLIGLLTAYHIFSSKKLVFRRALWLVIPMGLHGSIAIFQYGLIAGDPVWAEFTLQNQTQSPDLLYYVLGYLPFIIPIGFGARRFMAEPANDCWWLPILWMLLVAILIYGPFPTQRRYLLGVQTPLAVLAAYGWSKGVLARFTEKRYALLNIAFFALTAIAPLMLIGFNLSALSNPHMNTSVFYQPDELRGYQWIRDNTADNALILTVFDGTSYFSGGKLVAATGRRVFLGHWIETANFALKVEQVKRFYAVTTDDRWRQQLLDEVGITYIWYGIEERKVGDWDPAGATYLEAVYVSETVTIYQIKRT